MPFPVARGLREYKQLLKRKRRTLGVIKVREYRKDLRQQRYSDNLFMFVCRKIFILPTKYKIREISAIAEVTISKVKYRAWGISLHIILKSIVKYKNSVEAFPCQRELYVVPVFFIIKSPMMPMISSRRTITATKAIMVGEKKHRLTSTAKIVSLSAMGSRAFPRALII